MKITVNGHTTLVVIQKKKPTYWWALLSLVTWLESEPMALSPVRVDTLLIFTSRVDDL
jgi:hypothetical protein